MRHKRAGRKLGRDSAHRKALYANLACSLIENGRIKPPAAPPMEGRRRVSLLIPLGTGGAGAPQRRAVAFLRSKGAAHTLFAEIAPRFADRPGGYTRVVKLGPRQGDAAPMAYLELVDYVPARVPVAAST